MGSKRCSGKRTRSNLAVFVVNILTLGRVAGHVARAIHVTVFCCRDELNSTCQGNRKFSVLPSQTLQLVTYLLLRTMQRSSDVSVGTVARCQDDVRGDSVRFSSGVTDLSLFQGFETGFQQVPSKVFPGVERLFREGDNSLARRC